MAGAAASCQRGLYKRATRLQNDSVPPTTAGGKQGVMELKNINGKAALGWLNRTATGLMCGGALLFRVRSAQCSLRRGVEAAGQRMREAAGMG
jgi:hypothetical protein